jgi:hypothetical protein
MVMFCADHECQKGICARCMQAHATHRTLSEEDFQHMAMTTAQQMLAQMQDDILERQQMMEIMKGASAQRSCEPSMVRHLPELEKASAQTEAKSGIEGAKQGQLIEEMAETVQMLTQLKAEAERVMATLPTPGDFASKYREYIKLAQLKSQGADIKARVLSVLSRADYGFSKKINVISEERKHKAIEGIGSGNKSIICDQCSSNQPRFAQLYCSHWMCLDCTATNILDALKGYKNSVRPFQMSAEGQLIEPLRCRICSEAIRVQYIVKAHCDCTLDVALEQTKSFVPNDIANRILNTILIYIR